MNLRNDISCDLPFRGELETLFFEQMDRQTSAYLYGSAATGNWVSARSDLDVLILISENQIEALGKMIIKWKVTPGYPILDGFALYYSSGELKAKRLEAFNRESYPAFSEIKTIDMWNIKNRSKYLFGTYFVRDFPDVMVTDLIMWARNELRKLFGPSHSGDVPRVDLVLSGLIWSVSWAARLLMLARGLVCDSKRESLKWLAKEYIEIREPISLLLGDYYRSDAEPISITSAQSETLRKFLLKLLIQESSYPRETNLD
jgi:predicted nucleotidyltransferase